MVTDDSGQGSGDASRERDAADTTGATGHGYNRHPSGGTESGTQTGATHTYSPHGDASGFAAATDVTDAVDESQPAGTEGNWKAGANASSQDQAHTPLADAGMAGNPGPAAADTMTTTRGSES